MATVSLERDIKLSPKAVKNLVNVYNQPVKNNNTRTINAMESLHKGEEILKQLFSH